MLECINNKCDLNNNGVCTNPMFAKEKCEKRINPTHTPNYEEEYNKLKKENLEYTIRLNNQGNQIQKLFKEIGNYKQIEESQNVKIEALENIIEEWEQGATLTKTTLEELTKENEKLKQMNKNQRYNVESFRKENEELKKQNNQGYMEQMNITLNEKNEQIKIQEFNIGSLANDCEGKKETIIELQNKNRILKNKVEVLKESVINLTELL